MFIDKHFNIVYHDEHKKDKIYKVRPDYLEIFSGAILYNPKTGHWIDFYDREHIKKVVKTNTPEEKASFAKLVKELDSGK